MVRSLGPAQGQGLLQAPTWHLLVPTSESLDESQINSSLPSHTGRIEWHQDGPGCLKSLGGIKMKWEVHRGGVHPPRLWMVTRSLPEKLGSRMMPGEGGRVGP